MKKVYYIIENNQRVKYKGIDEMISNWIYVEGLEPTSLRNTFIKILKIWAEIFDVNLNKVGLNANAYNEATKNDEKLVRLVNGVKFSTVITVLL